MGQPPKGGREGEGESKRGSMRHSRSGPRPSLDGISALPTRPLKGSSSVNERVTDKLVNNSNSEESPHRPQGNDGGGGAAKDIIMVETGGEIAYAYVLPTQ